MKRLFPSIFSAFAMTGLLVCTLAPRPGHAAPPEKPPSDRDTLDKTQWFPVANDYDPFAPSPIDQAAMLDAPAGKHGFMKNEGGRWVFGDGAPVRLLAVLQSPFVPKDKKQAEYMARWLAKWGFNMVRFHALWDQVVDKSRPDSGHLDAGALDRMDYFLAQLARRGIYTRLSMLYYREVKPGDGVDMAGKDRLKTVGITFFDPRAMQVNIDLEKAIMTHRNPYRRDVMYGEDPAICQIEVTNEDSMFFYTIDGIPDLYKRELDRQWTDWLLARYGTRGKLAAAWGAPLAAGPAQRLAMWEYDKPIPPSRLRQARDQLRFYAELNSRYFNRTKQALRAAGVQQPINGSCWFGAGSSYYADLYSNIAGMDSIDRHQYWGGGPGEWRIVADPNKDIKYQCALQAPELLLKLSAERVTDLPFTVSEWANVLPNPWRLEAAPLMALYGNSLNGWDAPIHFAHDMGFWSGDHGFTKKLFWMWPVNEASTLCQYPALAQLVRRSDVREGPTVFERHLSEDQVFGAQPLKDVAVKIDISGIYEMSSEQGVNARSLAAVYAAAMGKSGVRFSREKTPDFSIDLGKYVDMKKKEIRSATGELYWNYGTGYVTADTPRTQAAVGFLTDVPVKLRDCEIRTGNRIASILVSSWDGKPLKESKHILITAVGRTRNTGMAYSRDGHRLLEVGTEPVLLEGVRGAVSLNRTGPCTVTALSPYGYKSADVAPTVERGKVVIPLTGENKAVYYDVKFE